MTPRTFKTMIMVAALALTSGCGMQSMRQQADAELAAATAEWKRQDAEDLKRLQSATEEQRSAYNDRKQREGDWLMYQNQMDEAVRRAIATDSLPVWPHPPTE